MYHKFKVETAPLKLLPISTTRTWTLLFILVKWGEQISLLDKCLNICLYYLFVILLVKEVHLSFSHIIEINDSSVREKKNKVKQWIVECFEVNCLLLYFGNSARVNTDMYLYIKIIIVIIMIWFILEHNDSYVSPRQCDMV